MPLCVRGAAPGYRDYGRTGFEGVARNAGNNGYSWSCTPTAGDVTVRYLDFNTQNLNPSNAHNRGHGFQVRCLQHLSGPLPLELVVFRAIGAFGHSGEAVTTPSAVGNYGSLWSAAVTGTNGVELMFLVTDVVPEHGTNRAHALQVRCLQHLSKSLPHI